MKAQSLTHPPANNEPGLAYMQQTVQEKPQFRDLQVFTNWSGGGGNPKCPSEHSYSKGSTEGSSAGGGAEQHKIVLHWTKLELEARRPVSELEALREIVKGLDLIKNFRGATDDPELTHQTPRHLTKSPADIVKDFLLTVSRQCYLLKQPFGNLAAGSIPLDVVLTHPAVRTALVSKSGYGTF